MWFGSQLIWTLFCQKLTTFRSTIEPKECLDPTQVTKLRVCLGGRVELIWISDKNTTPPQKHEGSFCGLDWVECLLLKLIFPMKWNPKFDLPFSFFLLSPPPTTRLATYTNMRCYAVWNILGTAPLSLSLCKAAICLFIIGLIYNFPSFERSTFSGFLFFFPHLELFPKVEHNNVTS